MNASNELSASLSAQVEALASVEPADEQVRAAQSALEQRLARQKVANPARMGKWVPAMAIGLVAVGVALLLPTGGDGIAFAEVHRHFAEFKTLSFVLDTRVGGQSIQQSRVYVNDAGDVRTDVGEDISVVVSTSQQQVLTLSHRERVAVRTPLGDATKGDDGMAWLEELRSYQRAAKQLGAKTVDGKVLHGWELEIQGMQTQLWADENTLPVFLEMKQPALALQMHFKFDVPLAPELFSVNPPVGYRQISGEDTANTDSVR